MVEELARVRLFDSWEKIQEEILPCIGDGVQVHFERRPGIVEAVLTKRGGSK